MQPPEAQAACAFGTFVAHLAPQPPQLSGSPEVFTHAPEQGVGVLPPHVLVHADAVQTRFQAHWCQQPPQLAGSLVVSTQAPLQSV